MKHLFTKYALPVLLAATMTTSARAESKQANVAPSDITVNEGPGGRRSGLGAVLTKVFHFKSKSEKQRQWLMNSPKKPKHLKRGRKPPVCPGNGGKY